MNEEIKKINDAVDGVKDRFDNAIKDLKTGNETNAQALANITSQLTDNTAAIEDVRALAKATRTQSNIPWQEGFGAYVLANTLRHQHSIDAINSGKYSNVMTGGTGTNGAALVPENFVPELIKLVEQYGVFRRNARNVPLSTETTVWPAFSTGPTVYAPGAGVAITPSDLAFANVPLVPTKLATLVAVARELGEDSALAIGALVSEEMARQFALAEDQVGFLGDGSGTYWGMTGIAGAITDGFSASGENDVTGGIVEAAGHLWSDITMANVRKLVSILPQYATNGAKFYCSKQFYYDVLEPLAELTTAGMYRAEFANGPLMTFKGYPVEFVDVMPKVSAVSQVCLVFGNLQLGAYFGQRRGFEVATSTDAYFTSDTIGIRATERIAINAFGIGTASVAGPICALVTHDD